MTNSRDQRELVSVLIPSNDTTYIAETLESVLSQTYKPLDVLVVLNGQAIEEINHLESTYGQSVRFLTCAEKGIVPSLNLGISNCEGRLIARIDADDLMPLDRIESQVNFLNENPLVVCVGGQLEYISNNVQLGKHPGYPIKDNEIKHSLYRFSAIPHPGMMYRKKEVEEIGGYSLSFPLIEDWDLIERLSKIHKLANLQTSVVGYRVHAAQSTMKYSVTQSESIKKYMQTRFKNDLKNFSRRKDNEQKFIRVRRSLAGYLYFLANYQSIKIFGKAKRLALLSLVTIIDPKIAWDFISKRRPDSKALDPRN